MGVFQKTFLTVTRFHNRRMVFANPSRDIPIIVSSLAIALMLMSDLSTDCSHTAPVVSYST